MQGLGKKFFNEYIKLKLNNIAYIVKLEQYNSMIIFTMYVCVDYKKSAHFEIVVVAYLTINHFM